MAKRLGPPPPAPAPQTVKPTEFVAARTKGLQLLATLQPASLDRIVSIDSAEGYLQMDAKLAAIRNTKAQWKLALEPIVGPLSRAIQKQKEALAEAKKAAEGATQLDAEITSRLDALERRCKQLMADYKMAEQRCIDEERQAREQETRRLQEVARQKALLAASAKTPQLKARLEQQHAELTQQMEAIQEQDAPAPVKGAASTSRTQQKVRIDDPLKFLRAVTDYEPTNGVYAMGRPPLKTTDRKGEEAWLVEIVSARLNDLFREQPGVVASWPGVTVYDDISIANR